jgi:adenylate cyclase
MICPSCQASTPDGSRFCNQCGASVVVICEACSTPNPAGSRFCVQCGARVSPIVHARQAGSTGQFTSDLVLARLPIMGDEQRRPVTVVFADIVGFTSLSERLDPEEVRDVTAACFGRLVEEIVRRGGTVDKFIGDAVMALFGTPIAHEDDAGRAVDAALAMQAALGEINGDLERDHGLRLELRIGVNTGEVVAGVREVGGFQDGTVIGDTVNTASRLQTSAAPGTVLVGEMTERLARHLFVLEPVPPLTLRGKAEPVQAFRAVGPLTGIPIANAASLPLIGRSAEVTALLDRVERLERGEGGVVVITGDPGSGKSRLLTELRRLVEVRPGIRLGEAHATPYGAGQTVRLYASWAWAFFAEELTELAAARAVAEAGPGLSEQHGDAVEVTLTRLATRLDQLGVPEALPFLCYLLELPRPPSAAHLQELAEEEIHRRGVRAIRRLHERLAAERPCIIAVDDLHWANPTILDFMAAVSDLTRQVPLLLVLSFRADPDAPSWGLREHVRRSAGDRFVELSLGPLGPDESRSLAQALLGGATLDGQVEALLLSRIDGNPLYAFELIQTLVDRGALTIKGGRALLDEDAARRVPETLQATILARIDRLPEEARRVVQTGAVLGRTFSRQLLTRVFGDGPALERGIREAVRAGVLVERPTPVQPGFSFSQGLVQEVAERTLLHRRRREIHRQAVDAIEAIYPDELSVHAQELANHAFAAESWDEAARYGLLAADRAGSEYATRQALRFYDLGLEATTHLGEGVSQVTVCDLLGGKARMLANMGRPEEVVQVLASALTIARTPRFVDEATAGAGLDPRRRRAQLALMLGTICMHRLETDAAEAALDEAFAVLDDHQPELANAWALRSWIFLHRNQTAEGAEAARTSLKLALANGGFEERAQAYAALTKPGLAGEIGPGIEVYANEAVRLAREHGHDGFLFEALLSREVLRQLCLQPHSASALAAAEEALELARRMDSLPAEGVARVILGAVYVAAGRWDDAERELTCEVACTSPIAIATIMRRVVLARLLDARGRWEEASATLDAIDDATFPHGAVWLSTTRAVHLLAAGDAAGARAAIDAALDAQNEVNCLACDAMLGGMGSEVLAALGDRDGALALADRADRAGDGAFYGGRLMAARARISAAIQAEDWAAALAGVEAADPLATTVGQPFERARLVLLHGTALARRGHDEDRDRARDLLAEALAVFEQLGARPFVDLAQAELGHLDAERASLPA